MVSIRGRVPSVDADIRLGDIVASRPCGQHGDVVQYDFEKTGLGEQHILAGSLNSPPQVLLTAQAVVEAARIREIQPLRESLGTLAPSTEVCLP
jgi:NACHT/LRR/PYD domain-containing protein 3